IPAGYVLGGKDKLDERLARVREGKKSNSQAAMQTFEASRPTVGAQALGIARAAYEYALDYAKEREQFSRKIIENQAVAFPYARRQRDPRCVRSAAACDRSLRAISRSLRSAAACDQP